MSILTPTLLLYGAGRFRGVRDSLYRQASFAIEFADGFGFTTRDDWRIAYNKILGRPLDTPGMVGNTRDLTNDELRTIIRYAKSIENK
jgi:hypothetical protein